MKDYSFKGSLIQTGAIIICFAGPKVLTINPWIELFIGGAIWMVGYYLFLQLLEMDRFDS